MTESENSNLVILSGPSAIGKNTLISHFIERGVPFVVPFTSRDRRPGEVEAKDYYFLLKSKFRSAIQSRKFEHWDYTLGNYYGFAEGTLQRGVTHALARMAVRIKTARPQVTLVFLMPPSKEVMVDRLKRRGVSGDALDDRLRHIDEEIEHASLFDFVLHVGGADDALAPSWTSLWREKFGI